MIHSSLFPPPLPLPSNTFWISLKEQFEQSLRAGVDRIQGGTTDRGAGLKVYRGYCRLLGKRPEGSALDAEAVILCCPFPDVFINWLYHSHNQQKKPVFQMRLQKSVFGGPMWRTLIQKFPIIRMYHLKQVFCSYIYICTYTYFIHFYTCVLSAY